MIRKYIPWALSAALLPCAACAHDQPKERTTVSTVTNEEVTDNHTPQNTTRMQYTEVDNKDARNSDGETPLAEGSAHSAGCERAVFFETGSAKLDAKAQEELSFVASCIKRHEIDHAVIVGRTDASGSAERNKQLGMERARAVADYLRKMGVPEQDIHVRSKGEVASAESEELWPSERRTTVGVQ